MGTYVIIGAGAIGPAVARQLVNAGHQVRVVSRRGLGPSHPNIELVAADASDAEQLSSVAKGATAIFNCANPAYHRWSTDWPPIATALLHAAEVTGADLVTLSNLYVYGHVTAPMSPGDPMSATYEKAQVRATMWRDAQRANDEGRVRTTEVRASDFIGPNAQGMVGERVMARLLKGRSCQVIGDVEAAHSWSYTEDVARTLVCAAQSDESWGRVWHAVTNAPRSSRQVIDDLADAAALPHVKVRSLSPAVVWFAGLFSPLIRELPQTRYQFESPFIIDDGESRARLGIEPTPWDEVVSTTVRDFLDRSTQ